MGQAAHDQFVTKCEWFQVGVTLFAEGFIGSVLGQYRLTLKDRVDVTDNWCRAPIKLSLRGRGTILVCLFYALYHTNMG